MDLRDRALAFQLTRAPADFIDDPYAYYAALRDRRIRFRGFRRLPVRVG